MNLPAVPKAFGTGYLKNDTKNIVIPRLDRGIQRKYKELDCPVKPTIGRTEPPTVGALSHGAAGGGQ